MNLMRFEKLQDDLARLDGTGKYATASNIVAGDPYFAQSIEAEYGQSIADLRKLVAEEEEAQAPASTRPKYSVSFERRGPAWRDAHYFFADDGVLVKRLRCDLAFELVDVFRDQLAFMFDEAELAGGRMRDRTSHSAKYQQMIQRSLELARQLGFATAPKPAPAGISAADLRELADLLAAGGLEMPGNARRQRIEDFCERLGAEIFGDHSTAGRPPLSAQLARLAASALAKIAEHGKAQRDPIGVAVRNAG